MKRKTTNSEVLSIAQLIGLGGLILLIIMESQFASMIGKIAIVVATILLMIFSIDILKKKNLKRIMRKIQNGFKR